MTVVTLYGRPGCHLCDDARDLLLEIRAQHPFALSEHDIEADDDLFRRYLERIPVIAIDGEERFELDFDANAVREALAAKVHP
jgi:glutaredoxin